MKILDVKANDMNRPVQVAFQNEDVDCLLTMLRQEDESYSYQQYLPNNSDLNRLFGEERLNPKWREKICQWSYNVVDHFGLCREVVGVSMNLFDRYLATRANHCSGNLALLTSLTTLHLAVKLEDSKKVSLDVLSQLSRGQFSREDIDRMEWSVLSELGWKVHPPTEYSFLAYFLMFLPIETPYSVRRDLEDLARYVCELAIYDSFFVGLKSSEISFAAFLNVMDDMECYKLPLAHREMFARNINRTTGLSACSESVLAARQRLRKMFVCSTSSYESSNIDNYSPQSVGYLSTNDKIARTMCSDSSSRSNTSRSSKGGKILETTRTCVEPKCSYTDTMQQRCVAVSPMVCSSSRVHKNYSPLASVN